jgi:flagellar biosynthesis chaperone FliJ
MNKTKCNIGKHEQHYLYEYFTAQKEIGESIQHLQTLKEKLENYSREYGDDGDIEISICDIFNIDTAIKFLGKHVAKEAHQAEKVLGIEYPG